MQDGASSEVFNTGLSKIRHEIKSQLASHGLYGTVVDRAVDGAGPEPVGSLIAVTVKGREASREFQRLQIEACHLRVDRTVLADITSMINDLAR